MGLATVRGDYIPVYEKPAAGSLRVDEVLYGMSVQLVQQSESGWSYVRTEYGVEGYTPTQGLETDEQVAAAWRKYKKSVVLAPYIDVQAEPAMASPRMVSLPRGGILVALGNPGMDGWQKVGLAAGAVGYTAASYIGEAITAWEQQPEDDLRWNIVETALSYSGAALRAGGRTPQGMDAVGLVAMSYAMNGVSVPRSPRMRQDGVLRPIKQKRMGEGDVLFFANTVGIYMGEGRFVHATDKVGSEGVVVSSLRPKDEDYRGDLAGGIAAVGSIFAEKR